MDDKTTLERKSLYDRLGGKPAQATDGPCMYRGRSMAEARRGMSITDAEFVALVEDLVKSLDKFRGLAQEKSELLSALGGMKGQIVGR